MPAASSKPEKVQRPEVRELDSNPKSNSGTLGESFSRPKLNVNVVEHSVAQHALTGLRNKHTATKQFREFSNQLLVLMAIDATRTLPTRSEAIETPADCHLGAVLDKPVIFLSLTRHGLGLAHGLADFIPEMSIGSINLDHSSKGKPLEPRLHLVNAPALNDAMVILFDPVVGSGFSAASVW